MKIGIYNQFWPTGGGGEKFAGGIAQVLAADHEVSLIGHVDVDLGMLGDRLQLDLSGVEMRIVDHAPRAIEAASARSDLFINASYGSVDRSAARRGLYIVHFPVMPPFSPRGGRKAAISVTSRLAGLGRAPLDVTYGRGVYAPERVGPVTYRWTDGDAELIVRGLRPGEPVTVVLGRLRPRDAGGAAVELMVDGRYVDGLTSSPRRRRVGMPLQFLQFTAPARRDGADEGDGDHGVVLRLRSDTHLPDGVQGRILGVPVLAVVVGNVAGRAITTLHEAISVPDLDRGFLSTYEIVANSQFTAAWVRRLWGRDATVLYPPVSPQPSGPKSPLILHVGRFFRPGDGHSKRQLELVEAFRRLRNELGAGLAGWELHLVGGCEGAGREYLAQVKAAAAGLPVFVHAEATADDLRELYSRASLYWHATGLGEDVEARPDHFEHFGISTVEAMSAGAVPVVIGAAGQLEVVDDGVEGFHFHDEDGLVARTATLIGDPERRAQMAVAAQRRAERYGWERFAGSLRRLVTDNRGRPSNSAARHDG